MLSLLNPLVTCSSRKNGSLIIMEWNGTYRSRLLVIHLDLEIDGFGILVALPIYILEGNWKDSKAMADYSNAYWNKGDSESNLIWNCPLKLNTMQSLCKKLQDLPKASENDSYNNIFLCFPKFVYLKLFFTH